MQHLPKLISETEVSKALGVAVATLRRWRWAGIGPSFVKVSQTAVRYDPEKIEAFINSGRRGSTSDDRCEAARARGN